MPDPKIPDKLPDFSASIHQNISELSNYNLVVAWNNCGQIEAKRLEASKHDKFKKMEFPSINPNFVKLKNEIKSELEKRKLI